MTNQNFTSAFSVDQTPKEAFDAINNVRGWWSEDIEGSTDKLGDEFSYRHKDVHHCKMKLIEVIQDKKVVWLVLDNYFNVTEDQSEWKGTKVIFEVSTNGDETEIRFTHVGLVPDYECFDVCSKAWGSYINGSLRSWITTGKGHPNQKEKADGKTLLYDSGPGDVRGHPNSARLTELKARLGVSIIPGDATDPKLAESALREVRPSVLVLNAGATPTMAPLHGQTWESFSKNWNTDVKATFHWIQGALRLPLERGSRVLISSSGAAIEGSPLSGGYAGAKRMIWMMAGYATGVASDLNLGIRFQALLVRQIVGASELGRAAADAYARRKGLSTEAFLAGFGKPLTPRDFGEHVATLLTDPTYESAMAFGIRGETGAQALNA